jgi:signal transduction histidine kinase
MTETEFVILLASLVFLTAAGVGVLICQTSRLRLKRNYKLMDSILKLSKIGLWSWDCKAEKVTIMKNTFKLVTERDGQIIALGEILARMHPDDHSAFLSLRHNIRRLECPEPTVDYRMINPSGGWRWFRAFPVKTEYNSDGKIASIIGLSIDITNDKLNEDALISAMRNADEANKAKSRFLAVISHEIRTPLNAIIGFSSILKESDIPLNLQSYAESIKNSGEMLLGLINGLLDLAKIESAKMDLRLEPVDLRSLLLEVRSMFAVKVQSKQLFIQINCARNLPLFCLDRKKIRQIFVNLVDNAVKFTTRGGVTIDVSATPHIKNSETDKSNRSLCRSLVISVQDTGEGIPQNEFDKIFNPFEQVGREHLSYVEGSGLGLAICKSLVELMQGDLEFESEIGVGTRFVVSLRDVDCVVHAEDQSKFGLASDEIFREPEFVESLPPAVISEISATFSAQFRAMENGLHVQSAIKLVTQLESWARHNDVAAAGVVIQAFKKAVEDFDMEEIRRISRMFTAAPLEHK